MGVKTGGGVFEGLPIKTTGVTTYEATVESADGSAKQTYSIVLDYVEQNSTELSAITMENALQSSTNTFQVAAGEVTLPDGSTVYMARVPDKTTAVSVTFNGVNAQQVITAEKQVMVTDIINGVPTQVPELTALGLSLIHI